MRVLIVEDDLALGMFLQKGLKIEGHEVGWAGDGDAAISQVALFRPELMVLDLGLPRRDGVDVLREIAGQHPEMSILVLTGRSDVQGRIDCLNGGADDYLQKPFSFHELIARCRALQRRRTGQNDSILRHDEIHMDRIQRKVRCGDAEVELTTKEFALLEHLLLHRNRCVSRRELLTEVWSMSPDAGTNVVDVYINYLRRKLGQAHSGGGNLSAIETVRGEGYRLRSKETLQRSLRNGEFSRRRLAATA